MNSTFKVLLYLRGNYQKKDNKSAIMIRVTLNGEMCQFYSKLDIEPDRWDAQLSKVKGKSHDALKMNALIEDIKNSVVSYYRLAEKQDGCATPEKIRNLFLGKATSQETILEVFRKTLERFRKLEGCGQKSPKTVEKYDRTYRRLESFLKEERRVSDVMAREVSFDFIVDFEAYLLSKWGYAHNTASKHLQIFRSIIISAKNNGIISVDPFHSYTITFKPVEIGYLVEEELQAMMKKSFTIQRLEHVRDIFVFCCYTGLAFIDVVNLGKENICKSFDGKEWIMTKRHKTGTPVNVPLLKVPLLILEKYRSRYANDQLLPKYSNQKMNAYLKEIADLCGITKNLTTHVARHTFATTTTLTKGVSIESVSKMLGHTKIKTTQIYAKVTNAMLRSEMSLLEEKLSGVEAIFQQGCEKV